MLIRRKARSCLLLACRTGESAGFQHLLNPVPYARPLPTVVPACDGRPTAIAHGHAPPRPARSLHPKDAVDEPAQISTRSAGSGLSRGQYCLNHPPLSVGEVRGGNREWFVASQCFLRSGAQVGVSGLSHQHRLAALQTCCMTVCQLALAAVDADETAVGAALTAPLTAPCTPDTAAPLACVAAVAAICTVLLMALPAPCATDPAADAACWTAFAMTWPSTVTRFDPSALS